MITGYITDGVGFVKNLEINGVSVKDKKIVVLGAGGAATAIQVQLALDGAKEVNIFNVKDKFYERAEGTKAKLAEKCPDCVVTVDDLADKAKLEEEIKTCDILINTTIMGMKPHEDVTLVDKSLFRKDLVVADTVYNPEKTKMILEAEEAGCKAIGGAGMLLQQGAVNYELFVVYPLCIFLLFNTWYPGYHFKSEQRKLCKTVGIQYGRPTVSSICSRSCSGKYSSCMDRLW